jgi:hypothetical protein
MDSLNFGSARKAIKLIGVNAPFEPKLQFGHEYNSDSDLRTNLLQDESVTPMHSREAIDAGIKDPAPQRSQTILSHQLSPQMQQILRGGISPSTNLGRSNQYPQIDHIRAGKDFNPNQPEKRVSQMLVVPSIDARLSLRMAHTI